MSMNSRSWAAPTQNIQVVALVEHKLVGTPFCDGKALFDFSLSMFELLSALLIKWRVLL